MPASEKEKLLVKFYKDITALAGNAALKQKKIEQRVEAEQTSDRFLSGYVKGYADLNNKLHQVLAETMKTLDVPLEILENPQPGIRLVVDNTKT